MHFTLIICTYKRPKALCTLLDSVKLQTLYPDEILVIDGSTDTQTQEVLAQKKYKNVKYFLADKSERGLTKQRNMGIKLADKSSEIICFLDDDTVLEPDYFEQLLKTYEVHPEALGVGGYIVNEVSWEKATSGKFFRDEFYFDGWKRKDGSRFVLRKRLGFDANCPPAYFPEFGHGRSVSFLPPSGKIYEVEQFMGGVSSFKRSLFDTFSFSTFFEGYGLYEDADFTLRISNAGKLYVNTAARLSHYHEAGGRPNHFLYGKMVVRNGWYVWRVKHPMPSLKNRFKWHLITLLLMFVRLGNVINGKERQAALSEFAGRFYAWMGLFFSKPK